ncbi:MAG: glycosyltransferase family 4 protein [Vulcanisaeta sp.]
MTLAELRSEAERELTRDEPSSSADRGLDRRLRVLLVAEVDPRIRGLRRGPQLRVKYAPATVRYYFPNSIMKLYMAPPSYEALSPLDSLRALVRQAARLLREPIGKGLDLAHTFFLDFTRFAIPCVHEADQSPGQYLEGYLKVDGAARRLLSKLIKMKLSTCRAVITWTSWAAKGFIADGFDRSRVYVVPPPLKAMTARSHRGVNVLIAARDPYRKGLDIALEAFVKASRGVEDARLTVIGPLKSSGLPRNVRVLAHVGDGVLHDMIMPATDIVLAPSRSDAYNLTVLEAMAHGAVPVVSSAGGLPELVSDGGFVTEIDDVSSVTKSLEALIFDEKLRGKLSRRAVEIVKERHNPEVIGYRLLEVYRRALEED